jgi:hypothetical protein
LLLYVKRLTTYGSPNEFINNTYASFAMPTYQSVGNPFYISGNVNISYIINNITNANYCICYRNSSGQYTGSPYIGYSYNYVKIA